MSALERLDAALLDGLARPDEAQIERLLAEELRASRRKIVVLDDDPTGVQTVHHISVYTDWEPDTLRGALQDERRLFFVLTNSRGLIQEQTIQTHRQIAQNLVEAARQSGQEFVLVSRSDSTLRGHYPAETQTLKEQIEALTGEQFDGEIICPFFREGGRFTLDNVHYVKEGSQLVPAGWTEFARDKTFGYQASHLGEWCEEKTGGVYRAGEMIYIPLDELRAADVAALEARLLAVSGFNKVIVNAVDTLDVKVFAVAFYRALARGKRFLLRSAAAIPKVLGGVSDRPLLGRADLVRPGDTNGGLVVIGSHVNKTTRQLEELRACRGAVEFIEFDQHLVLRPGGLAGEVARVIAAAESCIRRGVTAAVYTRRERLDLDSGSRDQQLLISVEISEAVSAIVAGLGVQPAFIIAKGGITSSDIGTKALRVRRATVLGQIRPGIPVWQTGPESKFPGMAYVIFPGNVGEAGTLREVVETLQGLA